MPLHSTIYKFHITFHAYLNNIIFIPKKENKLNLTIISLLYAAQYFFSFRYNNCYNSNFFWKFFINGMCKSIKFYIIPSFPLLINMCAKYKQYMCMLSVKLFFSNFPWPFLQRIFYYALPNKFSAAYDQLPSLILHFANQIFNYKCNRLIVERQISTYNFSTTSNNNVKRGQCHFIHKIIDI